MKRTILHSDLNNFYASCEQALNPQLVGVPFAVCGSVEDRHGIVLAKNQLAKEMGVKTAMTIKSAQDLCPDLVLVRARLDLYVEFSEKVRQIYLEFTDRVEPFGIDEAWLDVTNSKIFGTGEEIAEKIRQRVKELGLTVSVGVSFNKIFAKLGSDLKKPDAVTVITPENFKQKVWPLNVNELLNVGRRTAEKLKKYNVLTIGDLAQTDKSFLEKAFGKAGEMMYIYANGLDDSPVRLYTKPDLVKSVGNSMTCYRDLKDIDDVHIMLSVLADSVSQRVIRQDLGKASTVTLSIRDENLSTITRQAKLSPPSNIADDVLALAMRLFKENYSFQNGIRSLGIAVSDFNSDLEQLSIFEDPEAYEKKLKLSKTIGGIRDKYGSKSLTKAINLKDTRISREDPENTHTVHPKSFPTK